MSSIVSEHVQEAMLYVKGIDSIEPGAKLSELNIIKEIALKCGFMIRTLPSPSHHIEVDESHVSELIDRGELRAN